MSTKDNMSAAIELLNWYDTNRRRMPWRASPGQKPNPYHVWMSEVMLQQTTVATAGPYFKRFIARWPSVLDMARAELDEVLLGWAGLGYYARARNLHKCARVIIDKYGGQFPDNEAELLKLPGVGRYTAAAIAAIAFGRPAAVMDVNVERVMARLYSVSDPLPACKPILYNHVSDMTPTFRPGDYAQAVMDLGATVCTVRKPKCDLCPWTKRCRGKNIAEFIPLKRSKSKRQTRRGIAFWITNPAGAVLLRRRPEKGLLGGMMEVPSTNWVEGALPDRKTAAMEAPLQMANWDEISGTVKHTFSHFHLELNVVTASVDGVHAVPPDCRWCQPREFEKQALPTVMRKVARLAVTNL